MFFSPTAHARKSRGEQEHDRPDRMERDRRRIATLIIGFSMGWLVTGSTAAQLTARGEQAEFSSAGGYPAKRRDGNGRTSVAWHRAQRR